MTIDWTAAEETLYALSRDQFARFLAGPSAEQIYAVGFFLDPAAGDVFPTANTVDQHLKTYREHLKDQGPIDEQLLLWDTGLWAYPVGLFPESEAELAAFDRLWAPHREAVVATDDPASPVLFRRMAVEVLRRIALGGAFVPAKNLFGFTVQTPDDLPEDLPTLKEQVTKAVQG